jgi:hypothetical protein
VARAAQKITNRKKKIKEEMERGSNLLEKLIFSYRAIKLAEKQDRAVRESSREQKIQKITLSRIRAQQSQPRVPPYGPLAPGGGAERVKQLGMHK